MKATIAGIAALVGISAAFADEVTSVNKGQWSTTVAIVTAVKADGEVTFEPPEIDMEYECWATDADTQLNLDWLDLDGCSTSNTVATDTSLRADLYCSIDGVEMRGSMDISVAADKNSMEGSFHLGDELSIEGLSVDVVAVIAGQRVGSCAG